MKDIIISAKRIKTELITLAVCFLIAFSGNVGAVIAYKSPAIEILSSLHYVLIATVVLYILWSFVRILIMIAMSFFRKSK